VNVRYSFGEVHLKTNFQHLSYLSTGNCNQSTPMIGFLYFSIFFLPAVWSFVIPVPSHVQPRSIRREFPSTPRSGRNNFIVDKQTPRTDLKSLLLALAVGSSSVSMSMNMSTNQNPSPGIDLEYTWSPQDLTKDSVGFLPIPDDDYVKKYQENPELWPVEFFLIAYRRARNKVTGKNETQILVRKSANGTSQYGVGTGVPATRWMIFSSSQEEKTIAPSGYKICKPNVTFEAQHFPEFSKSGPDSSGSHSRSWTYEKIEIREDAFNNPKFSELIDAGLENHAKKIRDELKLKLIEQMKERENLDPFAFSITSVVKSIVDSTNSVAAIQGTLRMSGLFAPRDEDKSTTTSETFACPRYVSLEESIADPSKLVQSMRIYTMFPQMPDPLPIPSTSAEELQEEIRSRESRMARSGRDPHQDKFGRKFTHKSTSNVSNTIHGVYFTLDATNLEGLDDVPALDVFGTKKIEREWVSLENLKVLDSDGQSISTEDTKPTFISGFIVRQLVKENVIDLFG